MNEPPLHSPLIPLQYQPRPPSAPTLWPVISFTLGLILMMASATTPFLYHYGSWILPAGFCSLVISGLLFAFADRNDPSDPVQ